MYKKTMLLSMLSISCHISSVYAETIIKQETSDFCFRTQSDSAFPVNGERVVLSQNCAGDAANFSWEPGSSIKHVPTGRCVHPSGGSSTPENSTDLVLFDGCDFDDRVRFESAPNNSIRHVSGGQCIHPNGGLANPAEGTNILLFQGCGENRLSFAIEQMSGTPTPTPTPDPTPNPTPIPSDVTVNINLDLRHEVGNISTFSRDKYLTIHSINSDLEWFGNNVQSNFEPNEDPNLIQNFITKYDVYFGRDTGAMTFTLSTSDEDSNRTGFADRTSVQSGANIVKNYGFHTAEQRALVSSAEFENRMDTWILAAQGFFFPHGNVSNGGNTDNSWAFSQQDTNNEPIGTSAGDYMGNYVLNAFNQTNQQAGTGAGHVKPTFVEAANEPLFELIDGPGFANKPAEGTFDEIFRFHNAVANEVRALDNNSPVKIGGYTTAFPLFEDGEGANQDFFARWNARWASFLSTAGSNMDVMSIHLYDFEALPISSTRILRQHRKGSNIEATLDMLEHNSLFALGTVKPFVISEYGARAQLEEQKAWTPERDWLWLKSMSSMLVQFLERPNTIAKTVPFSLLKAEGLRNPNGTPYPWRLLRQSFEDGESATVGNNAWTYTELVKFYQLWDGVDGTRLDTWASDQDVLSDAYFDADTNDLYIILSNLEDSTTSVDLKTFNNSAAPTEVEVRHLFANAQGLPILSVNRGSTIPASVQVGPEATMIIRVRMNGDLAINNRLTETKYYAQVPSIVTTVRNIIANNTESFTINNVDSDNTAESTLRVGIARNHGQSLQPTITFNGTNLVIPTDYRGYDQFDNGLGRDRFFGTLEIPVPTNLVRENNTIAITFADDGGGISSVALQNFTATRELSRVR